MTGLGFTGRVEMGVRVGEVDGTGWMMDFEEEKKQGIGDYGVGISGD